MAGLHKLLLTVTEWGLNLRRVGDQGGRQGPCDTSCVTQRRVKGRQGGQIAKTKTLLQRNFGLGGIWVWKTAGCAKGVFGPSKEDYTEKKK